MNLIEAARLTDDEAREYMEKLRWQDGPVCPHCKSQDCTRLNGEAHRAGTIQCNECREQFTVTVGTVMESSKIPLHKWVLAFHLMCSSKKGISALQLQRELSLGSYRTAWFMAHRVRHAMKADENQEKMTGAVEADETYVGGKPRHSNNPEARKPYKRGRGSEKKTPVIVLVGRDGGIVSKPVERVDAKTLHAEIKKSVAYEAIIITDDWASYRGIGDWFLGGHETVNHSEKQYVRYHPESELPIHTNTAESFFALIKRGHYGIFHQLSKKHLHRYCDEFAFRWEYRKQSDAYRRDRAIERSEGKRLMYKTSPD